MATGKPFDSLRIKDAVKDALRKHGFMAMTGVQEQAIPHMLQRKDAIVQSFTGSGKTLAYAVPLANMIDWAAAGTQALIVVPTRELCAQIKETLGALNARAEVFIGGTAIEDDFARLNATLCVATPGRLLELMQKEPQAFKSVKFLVLDESDKLLDSGFESTLLSILSVLPKTRVTGLFSATVNDAVFRLAKHSLRNPVHIKATDEVPDKLQIGFLAVAPAQKLAQLLRITAGRKSIVFFATCAQVDFFFALLIRYVDSQSVLEAPATCGLPPAIQKIHGKMNQTERGTVYSSFQERGGLLFCTDVAARGIDFKDIDLVVHFDIPKDVANIVHRSGRTARNGSEGESVLFVMPNELAYVDYLRLKGTEVVERESAAVACTKDAMKSCMNEELQALAVRAFVSYFKSYKEHIVNYILSYRELDYDGLAELFQLTKIPSMPELRKVKFKSFAKPTTEDRPSETLKSKKKVLKKKKSTKGPVK
ncbi:ATP-dependent RNA helicase DDX55/SPB4 [Pancytospora philotis]|nr:ATP-dependent RNA helicase DDX55/SPB4 [Pancytospora philotis]